MNINFNNLLSLQILKLSHDDLTGNIFNEINQLSSLTFLDLSYNQLMGTIPSNLNYLHVLNIANNYFSGSLPSSLCDGNIQRLVTSGNPNLLCYASCLSTIASHDYGNLQPCITPINPTSYPTVAFVPTIAPTIDYVCLRYDYVLYLHRFITLTLHFPNLFYQFYVV